jgi:hypothetical protein
VQRGVERFQERRDFDRDERRSERDIRRVSFLIGSPVSLQGGFEAGKIEDIVLSDDGCVDYVIVLRDDKYVLVPWGAVRFDFGHRMGTIALEKEKFLEVPTFTREHWPNLSDTRYREKLYGSYGIHPGERRVEPREGERRDLKEERRERRQSEPPK